MKSKRNFVVISVIILILLGAGGGYFKVQQDKKEETASAISKLKNNQDNQEEILSQLKDGWDKNDSNYVSADFTKESLDDLNKKISDESKKIQNFKDTSEEEVSTLYNEQSKILSDIKNEHNKLSEAFEITNLINNSYQEKVIDGNEIKSDGHIKLDADLSNLNKKLNDSKTVNNTLKETANNLLKIGNEQIKEYTELKSKMDEVAIDGKFKSDITIEKLNAASESISKLKYSYLADEFKNITNQIPEKLEELKPFDMTAGNIERRVLAQYATANKLKNTNLAITEIENGQNNTVRVNIYGSIFKGQGMITQKMAIYTVSQGGSYEATDELNGGTRTGNLKDVTEEELSNIREDTRKPVIPTLTIDEFLNVVQRITSQEYKIHKENEMSVVSKEHPITIFKFNSETGIVEVGNHFEDYVYSQDMTRAIWNYFDNR